MPNVRLIRADGSQAGVVPTSQALQEAETAGLDLVEVSPDTDPPVCKIVDFGKMLYQRQKKNKKQVKTKIETKGVRLSLRIGQHDFDMKVKQAQRFIEKGHRVKVALIFKGREITHLPLGFEKMKDFMTAMEGIADVDQTPKKIGYTITAILKPNK